MEPAPEQSTMADASLFLLQPPPGSAGGARVGTQGGVVLWGSPGPEPITTA